MVPKVKSELAIPDSPYKEHFKDEVYKALWPLIGFITDIEHANGKIKEVRLYIPESSGFIFEFDIEQIRKLGFTDMSVEVDYTRHWISYWESFIVQHGKIVILKDNGRARFKKGRPTSHAS